MKRRLYFLFPDVAHAARAVQDLRHIGIRSQHMHTVARPDMDISTLPSANRAQRMDRNRQLENWLWDANLIVFFTALAALTVLVIFSTPSWGWAVPIGVMAICLALGIAFVRRVPNVHLNEFGDALSHGEILLMVDVPYRRVADVESRIQRLHPEAVAGGVGWTMEALHI